MLLMGSVGGCTRPSKRIRSMTSSRSPTLKKKSAAVVVLGPVIKEWSFNKVHGFVTVTTLKKNQRSVLSCSTAKKKAFSKVQTCSQLLSFCLSASGQYLTILFSQGTLIVQATHLISEKTIFFFTTATEHVFH